MPGPPRPESLRKEAARRGVSVYQVRVERGRSQGITARTAVGHGPIPVRIARGLERIRKGHPRALPVATLVKYRPGIAEYERRQWKGLETARPRIRTFSNVENLNAWLEDGGLIDVVATYGEKRRLENGRWQVRLLR